MKRRIIVSAVLLTITVFTGALLLGLINNVLSQLPSSIQMNYNYNSDFAPISILDIEKYGNKMSMKGISFSAELYETEVKDFTVTPVLINENYFEVMNIPLQGELPKNEKAAVISSDLAVKLFFNTNVMGKTIVIDNNEYEICGIYENPKGLINELSFDGKEIVYLYYKCIDNYEYREIQMLCYENSAPSAPLIEQMNLSQYHTNNLYEKGKIINNFKSIFFIVLYITFSIIALKIWYKLCVKLIADIKENLNENYFLKSIRAIPIKYLLFTVTAVGIPLLIIIVFLLADFSIFIPAKYIPYDNIFDIPYYISKIIENSKIINSSSITGDSCFIQLYNNCFNIISLLLSDFIILFLIFIIKVNLIVKDIYFPKSEKF